MGSNRNPTMSLRLQAGSGAAVALRPFDEELGVERNTAAGIDIELHHPAVDALRVELWVDRAIKRVGEIYTFAVSADLHHLRSAVEMAIRCRMCGTRDDSADPDLSNEPRSEGVGDVILQEIFCTLSLVHWLISVLAVC